MDIKNTLWFALRQIIMYFVVIISTILIFHIILGLFLIENFSILSSFQYIFNILIYNYGKVNLGNEVSVTNIYLPYFGFSFILVIISFVISLIIAFSISYWLVKNNKSIYANAINLIIFIFSSIPIFILGPIAIVFAQKSSMPINFIESYFGNIWLSIYSLILPIIILILVILPLLISINTQILKSIFNSNYYKLAQMNSLSKNYIWHSIILKNWFIEFAQNIILIYIYLLSYCLIIERFFYMPGQSFIFQYLSNSKYFSMLMYSILLNLIVIGCIKSFSELLIYYINPIKEEVKLFRWRQHAKTN